MDTLERNFKDEIKKQFSFHKVGTEIINQKLLKKVYLYKKMNYLK